jgi:hypothetical protein
MGQSLAVGGHRLGVGVPPGGAVGEAREVLDGLVRGGRARVVIGEAIVDVLQAAGMERLQRGGHAGMQALASRGEEAAVGDFLDEGVLEDVDRLAARRLLVQELQPLQLGQRALEHVGRSQARRAADGNQPPITEASWTRRLASAWQPSMRAISTSWMVPGSSPSRRPGDAPPRGAVSSSMDRLPSALEDLGHGGLDRALAPAPSARWRGCLRREEASAIWSTCARSISSGR